MSGLCGVTFARGLSRLLRAGGIKQWSRGFLSASYSCDDAWQRSIDRCPEIAKLDKELFFMELEKTFKNNQKVLPIDIDMFTVAATTDQDLDDLQNMTYRFRRTPLTIAALPSTAHALVRGFLRGSDERIQRLMHMLDDRMNYGVFLDYYTAIMLMNRFLLEKNHRDAARVASNLMLQEEWNHPIAVSMALLSCVEYDITRQPEPWNTLPQPEDDGETVYVRVNYLRNEWHDDHFDLSDPSQIIGKTLAWLSRGLTEQLRTEQFQHLQLLSDSCQLLGWTLYGKWEEVSRLADLLAGSSRQVTEDTKRRVSELLQVAPAEAAGDSLARAVTLVDQLPTSSSDLKQLLTELVEGCVSEHSEQDRNQLERLYDSWSDERIRELHVQREAEDRESRIEALERKRSELREKERLLYFFDNEEEIRLDVERTWYKPVKPKPAAAYKQLRKQRTVQDDYVPPKIGEHKRV